MGQDRFRGIVLFKRPYKDADALVKIFTQEFGARMFFVRGLAKSKHSLQGVLVSFKEVGGIASIHDQGFSFIKEASSLKGQLRIQSDYQRQVHASYLCQLTDAVIEDRKANAFLYQLLLEALSFINDRPDYDLATIHFELHLLPLFGYRIQWQECLVCQSQEEPFSFSIQGQGVLCPRHAHLDAYRLPISGRALHIAKLLSLYPLSKIQTIQVSSETLADLRRLMDELYREYVGIRVKSKRFLDDLYN